MTVRRAPRRRARGRRLDGVARLGTLLVVALVVAIPLTLAFCPADALDGGASGAGAGTGDVVAAALSSLERDLHGPRALPAPTADPRDHGTAPFAAHAGRDIPGAHRAGLASPPRHGARQLIPGDARAGTTDLGHPLLR